MVFLYRNLCKIIQKNVNVKEKEAFGKSNLYPDTLNISGFDALRVTASFTLEVKQNQKLLVFYFDRFLSMQIYTRAVYDR